MTVTDKPVDELSVVTLVQRQIDVKEQQLMRRCDGILERFLQDIIEI
jgi:hypothetical protein